VNQITGSGLSEAAVTMCAELIIDRFKYRTPNALRLALMAGLNSGKMFGKLTYPIIAEWLTEHEDRMEDYNYQQHIASK
jgi:poly-beta-hydroxyalkanoate depolymerase